MLWTITWVSVKVVTHELCCDATRGLGGVSAAAWESPQSRELHRAVPGFLAHKNWDKAFCFRPLKKAPYGIKSTDVKVKIPEEFADERQHLRNKERKSGDGKSREGTRRNTIHAMASRLLGIIFGPDSSWFLLAQGIIHTEVRQALHMLQDLLVCDFIV